MPRTRQTGRAAVIARRRATGPARDGDDLGVYLLVIAVALEEAAAAADLTVDEARTIMRWAAGELDRVVELGTVDKAGG